MLPAPPLYAQQRGEAHRRCAGVSQKAVLNTTANCSNADGRLV